MRLRLWCAIVLVTMTGVGTLTAVRQSVPESEPLPEPRPEVLVGPVKIAALPEPQHSLRAHPHPHGETVCASGCALSRHPTPRLTAERFAELIRQLANAPTDQRTIDELLYFGPQTRAKLLSDEPISSDVLTESVRQMLLSELRRTHASVEVRLVAESGRVLADLPEQLVPLDLRHEFDLQEHDIPPLLASGTVKRVGRYRLWSRL